MRNIILSIFFILLFSGNKGQMTIEERENLLKKSAIQINEKNFIINKKVDNLSKDISFKYDAQKIKEIINKYRFPEKYNFIEEEKITAIIKNQEGCGSCWSFASTTALSYRFKKQNIEVDLSPQEPISCFHPSCSIGETGIGAQLNLIKNGTVTEECMPYSSNKGIVEKCSYTCKDGSEKKKYYSKNAYIIEPMQDEENYYDYIAIIMDQLINYGPVVSSITTYEDFMRGNFDIYSYDGKSSNLGGHAIVIFGYGVYNDRYYWLIQNSWGEDWGENGFAKIEFGQVGVEKVCFSEPNILEESLKTKDISVNLLNTVENSECFINFSADSSNEDIHNNFELVFKNKKNNDKIYYYCGVSPLMGQNSHICLNNLQYTESEGEYELDNFSSLGKENNFAIKNDQFIFYLNTDFFSTLRTNSRKFYVSENGSKILFASFYCDECKFKSNIYPNVKASNPLEDCKQINFNDMDWDINYYLVSCSIKKNELNYFDYSYNNGDNSLMAFDTFCRKKFAMNATIYLLDKTKYPLFRVKDFILPKEDLINIKSEFTLIADIEGNMYGFSPNNIWFYVFIDIVNGNKYQTYELYCRPSSTVKKNNYEITCHFLTDSSIKSTSYENIILYPYTYQIATTPYEVIINYDSISDIDGEPQRIIGKNHASGLSSQVIVGLLLYIIGFSLIIA